MLNPGTYIVTKRITAATKDELKNQTYLDTHINNLREIYTTSIEDKLRHYPSKATGQPVDLYALLDKIERDSLTGTSATKEVSSGGPLIEQEKAYLSDLYRHLGVDPNATTTTHIDAGCLTIEIPVLVCESDPCPPEPVDFVGYFLNRWKDKDNQSYIETDTVKTDTAGGSGIDYLTDYTGKFKFLNYQYTRDEFNNMINNMINDGYDCKMLWECWKSVVQSYESLLQSAKSITATNTPHNEPMFGFDMNNINYKVDIVDLFITCAREKAGRGMEGFTTTPFGTPGYLSHAYAYFNYEVGRNHDCENLFCQKNNCANGIFSLDAFRAADKESRDEFYQCVKNMNTPGSSTVDVEQKATEFIGKTKEFCEDICESRRESFIQAIVKMFRDKGLTVLTPDQPTDKFDISWKDVQCMAESLVEHCKQNCTLTPIRDPQGRITAIGTNEPVFDSQGNLIVDPDNEVYSLMQSLTYGYELQLPGTGSVCAEGFEKIVQADSVKLSGTQGSTEIKRKGDNAFGGKNGDNKLWAVQKTKDGFILAGYSDTNLSGDKSSNSKGGMDYWLVKLDNSGKKVWDVTIGGEGGDVLLSVQQTKDGGYFLGGYSSSDKGGDKHSEHYGERDYWLVKVDKKGHIMWEQTYGGSGDDVLTSVREAKDGDYILGGYSNSSISGNKTLNSIAETATITEGTGPEAVPRTQRLRNTYDYWIIKVDDKKGKILWQQIYGTEKDDILRAIRQTSDGGYIAGGYTNGDIKGSSGKTKDSINKSQDFWVIKLDANGNRMWDKSMGGGDEDCLLDLEQTDDNGYILAGYSLSDGGYSKSKNSYGQSDYWIVKLDNTGRIEWDRTFGGSKADAGESFPYMDVMQTSDGGYLVGGTSLSDRNYTKSENSFNKSRDFWLVKTDKNGGLEWDKTIGGTDDDYFTAVTEEGKGCYYAAGFSQSPDNFSPSCGSNCDVYGWKSKYLHGRTDYWIVRFCQELENCNHRDVCFRWKKLPEFPAPHLFRPYTCEEVNIDIIRSHIRDQIYNFIQNKLNEFKNTYMSGCANRDNIRESFHISYPAGYHHYTLYYYDRAGNLIKTAPPKGVKIQNVNNPQALKAARTKAPEHSFVTDYEYNSLGQLVRQHTPDGGETHYYYNSIGQQRFSQNAQQLLENVYSYTKYDKLGRVIEVGESGIGGGSSSAQFLSDLTRLNDAVSPSTGSQRVFTIYSMPATTGITGGLE